LIHDEPTLVILCYFFRYLIMYPSGIDDSGEFLSLYLNMAKPDASLQRSGALVELSLSIKDQVTSNRYTRTGLPLEQLCSKLDDQ
jgi:hypothetical protein